VGKRKLLVICGPTAVGKTRLAIRLAKKFDGEVVSADSRQVYKKMNIGTGKDLPENFEFRISNFEFKDVHIAYFTDGNIRLWGYDLVEPCEEFSVHDYAEFFDKVSSDIWSRGKLPILAGGTGFYIKAVLDGVETMEVPRNYELRRYLEKKNVKELYEQLCNLDSSKAASLNQSDKKNPRRLVRAIEVAQWRIDHGKGLKKKMRGGVESYLVGLTMPMVRLDKVIEQRVEKRVADGFDEEVRRLVADGIGWECQAMSGLGYKQWQDVIDGQSDESEAISIWKMHEKKYARRQMSWFKKDERIVWFDVSKWYKI